MSQFNRASIETPPTDMTSAYKYENEGGEIVSQIQWSCKFNVMSLSLIQQPLGRKRKVVKEKILEFS